MIINVQYVFQCFLLFFLVVHIFSYCSYSFMIPVLLSIFKNCLIWQIADLQEMEELQGQLEAKRAALQDEMQILLAAWPRNCCDRKR